jgi:hypothetical protein
MAGINILSLFSQKVWQQVGQEGEKEESQEGI